MLEHCVMHQNERGNVNLLAEAAKSMLNFLNIDSIVVCCLCCNVYNTTTDVTGPTCDIAAILFSIHFDFSKSWESKQSDKKYSFRPKTAKCGLKTCVMLQKRQAPWCESCLCFHSSQKKPLGPPGKDNPVGMGSFESIGLAKNSPNPFIYWTGAILDRITFVFISHAHQLFWLL